MGWADRGVFQFIHPSSERVWGGGGNLHYQFTLHTPQCAVGGLFPYIYTPLQCVLGGGIYSNIYTPAVCTRAGRRTLKAAHQETVLRAAGVRRLGFHLDLSLLSLEEQPALLIADKYLRQQAAPGRLLLLLQAAAAAAVTVRVTHYHRGVAHRGRGRWQGAAPAAAVAVAVLGEDVLVVLLGEDALQDGVQCLGDQII